MGGGESGGSGGHAASAVERGFSPVRGSVTHLCKSSRLSQSVLSLSLPLAMHTSLAALKFHPLPTHTHIHIPPPYTHTHSAQPMVASIALVDVSGTVHATRRCVPLREICANSSVRETLSPTNTVNGRCPASVSVDK